MPIPGRSRFDVCEPDRQAFQCVDPSGSRPCGFPLGDGGEIGDSGRADLRELLPPLRPRIMHRRSFARGVPLSGLTIFLAALSDRVLPTTLMGFDPSQFSSCLSVPVVFPHRRAHLSFAAHPPRYFYSRDRPSRSTIVTDRAPLHPQEFQEATDRSRMRGSTPGIHPGKQAVRCAIDRDLIPTLLCRQRRSCHGLCLFQVSRASLDAPCRARPRPGHRPPCSTRTPSLGETSRSLSAHGLCEKAEMIGQTCRQ
jgi:hypothetical protein